MATKTGTKKQDDHVDDQDEEIEDEDEQEEEEQDEEDDDEEEDEDSSGKKKSKIVKLSQDRLNQITTREHKKGEREGKRSILKELGFKSLDEAKAKINGSQEEDDKDSSGNKNKNDGQQTANRESDDHELRVEKAATKIERLLIRAKVQDDRLDKAVKLIDPEEHIDSDEDDIKSEIDALMEDLPELFESDEDSKGKKRKSPRSNPGGAPKRKPATPSDRAKDRLQRRHGAKLQKQ